MNKKPTDRKTTLVRISKRVKTYLDLVSSKAGMKKQEVVDMAISDFCANALKTKTITKRIK
jgi:hypothetical protein